jgi:hypothetical protein
LLADFTFLPGKSWLRSSSTPPKRREEFAKILPMFMGMILILLLLALVVYVKAADILYGLLKMGMRLRARLD